MISHAGETGTSSTLPRANAPTRGTSRIEFTSNSHGAAVVSENISLVAVTLRKREIEQAAEQYKADVMLQALLQRASCAPETKQPELLHKCLQAVLPVCNGQVRSARGIYSSGVDTALKKYVRPGAENSFYSPFIEATNIALVCLEEIKTKATESAVKKSRINPDEPYVTVQTGLYAAEMFAANHAVDYLINLIVIDDVIWIWYYDREGTIQSSGINFIQDLPRFMVLLYALQRFELNYWSRNMDFLPVQVEGKCCHQFKIKDEGLGDVDLLLHTNHDERVTHYGLQGRATNVVPVTGEALAKECANIQDGVVAKILWSEVDRTSLHTSQPKILDKVKEIAKVHSTVKDHIPELLWHHTFTNPTSAIREALGIPEPTTGSSRVLYILVFRKLHPITKLHGKELFDVWYQCIQCHVTLWKEGVFHRDVSPGNLMWYRSHDKLIGVLNDYDLSSLADDQGPRGNERTGTVPFMALEFLSTQGQRGEVKHLYRHDLWSFMWCFAWISLRYENGALLPMKSRRLDDWATSGAATCGMLKLYFLNNLKEYRSPRIESLMWKFLVECFVVLKKEADARYYLGLQWLSDGDEQPNSEESESNIDGFLQAFKNTTSWAALSKPSQ
ncbi:hypothetical protein BDR03DRAFT_973469 [Suillus americanus]|nr:hypothetical protein BDR03DRAFT_973469 [Suillus americanus]